MIKRGVGGFRFTCSSWPVNPYFGSSAVGDVYGHPETTTQHSSPNVNVTTTSPTATCPIPAGEVADKTSRTSYTLTTSALIHQSCLPAEMRISSLSNRVNRGKNHLERLFDTNLGKFIQIIAVSINFFKRIFTKQLQKKKC